MRLEDVIKLPKEPQSLSIIKSFIEQPLSHRELQAALNMYFEVANIHKLYELVFDEGVVWIKSLIQQEHTPYLQSIIKHIFDAALQLKDYVQCSKLIELRKEHLPILKQYLASLDEVMLKKDMGQPYINHIMSILSDTTPEDTKILCYEMLYTYYVNNQDYDLAHQTLLNLYDYDLKYKYEDDEFTLLTHLKAYDQIIGMASKHIKKGHLLPNMMVALLESYIEKKDFHKAINLEAEYEAYIDDQSEHIRKNAYQLLIRLYESEQNRLSLNIYQKKLKSILKNADKKEKIQKPLEQKSEVVYIKPLEKPLNPRIDTFKKIETFQHLLIQSHLIDHKLKLRDYLRLLFIEIETFFPFKEAILYLSNQTPNFYLYKKERLYDKNIFDFDLKDTLVDFVISQNEEILGDPIDLKFQKNIVTQKSYDETISYVYAYPISDIGVFLVHLDQKISDPAERYDDFKWIAHVLHAHILDENILSGIKKTSYVYQKIIDSALFPFRLHSKIRSTYNKEAQSLFHIDTHHHIEMFLRDVSYEHIKTYQKTLDYLMTHPNEKQELVYPYQQLMIHETMVSIKIDDDIYVASVFQNQSQSYEQKKQMIEKATLDPSTGLLNFHTLNEDLSEALNEKASLCLIELNDSIKHIYGGQLAQSYFKEFCQLTKKFFTDGTVYRKDVHQILAIIPINDIRAVTKQVKDYIKHMHQATSVILPYEAFSPIMTILRYPVVTTEKNKEKILHYLDIGLERIKRQKTDVFDFFVYRDYEEEMFEQQVILALNQAIEHQQLSLVFNQITDVKKNKIWQYESELAMPNLAISSHYLMSIAKKRNRLIELEKHHIEKVCRFLVELEKQTDHLVKITIPISKQTFIDTGFNAFILNLLKANEIPYEFIRLKLDMDVKGKYAQQILELVDHGLSIDTTSLQMALTYPLTALHMTYDKDTLKAQKYIQHLKQLCDQFHMAFIMRQVKTKEQKEALERLGVTYIEGPIYKQLKADLLLKRIKENL